MAARGAVTRNTLRQQIADALRDEVLAGRLKAGEEFTVKQIADQYGVSATPVREAFVDLCAQGLLDCDQHRGFRVHPYSIADYRGMVEARTLVVDGLFRRHVPGPKQGPPDEPDLGFGVALVSVRRRGEAAARAARAGDLDILVGYDVRYWRELGRLVSANDHIAEFLHRLRIQGWAFSVPHLRAERDPAAWLWSGHVGLVDAVTRGDDVSAAQVIRDHETHCLAWAERLEARAG
ncbi:MULTISPECIES: GntR family transcriptional regulator [unclassified Streptomyces]|uniref:GntR family transcriptional regulator n=1 Tax=unclassified Streptomyces TaxID=2593676 RepID=UPI001660DAD0|nr:MULTISPECIES: GntR family transcriptional regulator [unclassified Streptomyces]MBD0712063.1 GntR family transcriptional regulator [Streptomyces sp. CBMA291]MBD0717952.1 GntR family transcriptional regulator [Streptomyces sp. CBMA370]